VSTEITPTPTDEEAVAIAASIHALWPVPVMVTDEERAREASWKFSGRWWNRPISSRRDRPHR
jgi:hypothetical protein